MPNSSMKNEIANGKLSISIQCFDETKQSIVIPLLFQPLISKEPVAFKGYSVHGQNGVGSGKLVLRQEAFGDFTEKTITNTPIRFQLFKILDNLGPLIISQVI